MKHLPILSLTLITLAITPVFATFKPDFNFNKNSSNSSSIQAQAPASSPIQLQLEAEQKLVTMNEKGQEITSWKALEESSVVQPGDIVRFTVKTQAENNQPVQNFVITQPIPPQTIYVLNTAISTKSMPADVTYSIDNGKSFLGNPTVQVTLPNGTVETQPAPAEAYTHIRWIFPEQGVPSQIEASYQVKVK
jgi:uncharacterized repeat protein (TIGR01451 family)